MVLKELTKTETYRNFHSTTRAFQVVGGLDMFAKDVYPIIQACYELNKPVEYTAKKLDTLTEMTRMAALLNIAENKLDGGR